MKMLEVAMTILDQPALEVKEHPYLLQYRPYLINMRDFLQKGVAAIYMDVLNLLSGSLLIGWLTTPLPKP